MTAVEITIPKLVEMAAEQVELASVPFATFIGQQEARRGGRLLFIRAPGLCPSLDQRCLGRIRPRAGSSTWCSQRKPPKVLPAQGVPVQGCRPRHASPGLARPRAGGPGSLRGPGPAGQGTVRPSPGPAGCAGAGRSRRQRNGYGGNVEKASRSAPWHDQQQHSSLYRLLPVPVRRKDFDLAAAHRALRH